MRYKNISSSEVNIEDLGIYKLRPGDVIDLSHIDRSELALHDKLNLFCKKGILANLGHANPPSGSKASLVAAKNRIDQLKIMGKNKNVIKPASPSYNKKQQINDLIRKNQNRSPTPSQHSPNKERYRDEYLENNPGQYEEDIRITKPEIEHRFIPPTFDYDGDFGLNGNIETGIITGETTKLSPKKTDRDDFRLPVEKIKEKILRRCAGTTSSGKPCKKYAVKGFETCLTHMTKPEKLEYQKLKQSRNSN